MEFAGWTARSMLDSKIEKECIRTRALAERAKSEAYRYATRVPPHDDDNASGKLLEKSKELIAEGEDLPVTEAKGEDASKDRPGYPLYVQDYFKVRIDGQVNGFFGPKAEANERMRYAACEPFKYLARSRLG